MVRLVYLHPKTCIAEVWSEDVSDPAAVICTVCAEARKRDAVFNLAVPNRDGWIEAALQVKERGLPIQYVITNAPAGSFSDSAMDSFFVNEARQANFVRKILAEAEYLLSPETAGVYCALQSHRIARIEPASAVILALQNPIDHAPALCGLLDVAAERLPELMRGRKRFMEY